MTMSHGRADPEQTRRIRSGLYGRGPLTRQDAELLRSRPPYTWGAKYETLVIAAVLFWAAVLIFGLVRHTQMARLVIPLIFLVAGVPAWWLGRRARRRVRQALTD